VRNAVQVYNVQVLNGLLVLLSQIGGLLGSNLFRVLSAAMIITEIFWARYAIHTISWFCWFMPCACSVATLDIITSNFATRSPVLPTTLFLATHFQKICLSCHPPLLSSSIHPFVPAHRYLVMHRAKRVDIEDRLTELRKMRNRQLQRVANALAGQSFEVSPEEQKKLDDAVCRRGILDACSDLCLHSPLVFSCLSALSSCRLGFSVI
jgi:hypothetical protein